MTQPDLQAAASAIELASGVIRGAISHLAETSSVDADQVLAYDIAHASAAVETARSMLDYGNKGDIEAKLTCVFVADAVADLGAKIWGREAAWACSNDALDGAREFVAAWRDPADLAELAYEDGPRHLDSDFELVQDTFRRFADEQIKPQAEHIHRENADIPDELIAGLGEMGVFGLSIPEEFGGFATGGESDYYGMVIATEELSRASLGAGGSLITRPEILARALEAGGTEEQKNDLAPPPGHRRDHECRRRDRTRLRLRRRRRQGDGHPDDGRGRVAGWLINGVKTWCTFGARADVLMVLARTDPDRSKGHRGLSIFIVPKDRGDGHGFTLTQEAEAEGVRARWRPHRSTRSATEACTPTRSPSRTGSCRPRI